MVIAECYNVHVVQCFTGWCGSTRSVHRLHRCTNAASHSDVSLSMVSTFAILLLSAYIAPTHPPTPTNYYKDFNTIKEVRSM
ncbi:hypothetical protein E2C01_098038 [Portunus trituberculatus]|uniref:Uncharacterized protein n=1 Tax=Portunus trituberculatus TaxID=210409 RepID=A0A5B7K775_PORTR|nr:hypothetical protein [Portunus trituberculatus]